MESITAVVTQAERRRRARVGEEYRRRIGPLPDWDVEADEADWPTLEIVRDLQAVLRTAEASQALALRQLFRFTVGEYLLRQTQGAGAIIQTRQQAAVLEVPILDEPVPFWQVSPRLALERKRVMREALESTSTSLIQSFEPLYRDFWTRLFGAVEALGYPHLIGLWEEVFGVSLETFVQPLEAILRDTEDTYRERMQWHLKRTLGIRLEEAKRHDILALFGVDDTATWFPRVEMLPTLRQWLGDWGWQLHQYSNLRIVPYPTLAGGSWCAALEIPGDIRLAIAPGEGMRGYAKTFRETGKGLLLASLPADIPRELRCFLDPSLLEAQAELYGGLNRSGPWVRLYRHVQQPEEGLSLARLERLYVVRRYLGKCVYERTFYEDAALDGKEEAYRDALRHACGFAYPETYYLFDIDPGFSSFWNVRAWMLAAAIHQQLQRLYAEEWFRESDARLALDAFWSQSPSQTFDDLIAQVNGSPVAVDAVVADLLGEL